MEKNWKTFLYDRGVQEDLITIYLSYIKKLEKNSIPVIFELEHLSKMIGIKYPEFNNIVFGTSSFYRKFKIPKKRGGFRNISTPYPSLLSCQKWIYTNILLKIPTHQCAQAYKKGHSIIKNAACHLDKKALLKIDIQNFFTEIPISWVIRMFIDLGYPRNISHALASLCCLDGALPQGAVTSPCLSNILLFSLDHRLSNLSNRLNLTYSRYADDIVFSGEKISPSVIKYVRDIIESYGFSLNESKTQLLIAGRRKIVTGIDVSSDKMQLPRKSRREIKQAMHFIKKYGLVGHMSNEKIKDPNYLLSLEGKIRFWLQIDAENLEAKTLLNEILIVKKNHS